MQIEDRFTIRPPADLAARKIACLVQIINEAAGDPRKAATIIERDWFPMMKINGDGSLEFAVHGNDLLRGAELFREQFRSAKAGDVSWVK